MENHQKDRKQGLLTEGTLLALASSYAYFLAYNYELGFGNHFWIPTYFVNVSLTNVLYCAGLVLLFLIFMYHLANFASLYIQALPPVLARSVSVFLLVIVVIVVIPMWLVGLRWQYLMVPVFFVVITGFVLFISPLFTQRDKESYIEKLMAESQPRGQESATEETAKKGNTLLSDLIAHRFGRLPIAIAGFLIMGVYLSRLAGESEAMYQLEFLVTDTSPQMVVLRMYGDNLICAPFDRERKEVQSNFTIIKVAGSTPKLNLERIGYLHAVWLQAPALPAVQSAPAPTITPSDTPSPLETAKPAQD